MMATSTVARTLSSLLSLVLFLVALASAGSVQPSNSTLPSAESDSETQLKLGGGPLFGQAIFNIVPLTANVGLGQSAASVAVRILPILHFSNVFVFRIIADEKPCSSSSSAEESSSQILRQ
jgi:hypothetical protein